MTKPIYVIQLNHKDRDIVATTTDPREAALYEEGMYNIDPHTPHVDKLERMVKGLQQSTADMVDGIEAPLKLRGFVL